MRERQALTPADADEHPLAKLVRGVREHDGRVQVATLAKHPEKVGDMEVIVGSSDQAAPNLSGDVEPDELCVTVVQLMHRAAQTLAEQSNLCFSYTEGTCQPPVSPICSLKFLL